MSSVLFCLLYCTPPVPHVLTHSFPPRRSSDLFPFSLTHVLVWFDPTSISKSTRILTHHTIKMLTYIKPNEHEARALLGALNGRDCTDRKSTRLNSSH